MVMIGKWVVFIYKCLFFGFEVIEDIIELSEGFLMGIIGIEL